MTPPTTTVAISLGSNIGNRAGAIRQALRLIEHSDGVSQLNTSGLYSTTPVGYTDQPEFINCAATLETTCQPEQLLALFRGIEQRLGRTKRERWRQREIDIDILLFGDQSIATPTLTIPHPEMGNRAFVLVPLSQIAPSLRHPGVGLTVAQLLDQLPDRSGIEPMEEEDTPLATDVVNFPRHIRWRG